MKNRHKQKLVILSIILMVMLNVPVLFLFNDSQKIFGLPMIYAYIFLVWLSSCAISFLIFKKFNE